MVMQGLKQTVRSALDTRVRDSLWALRSRGDTSVLKAVVRGTLGVHYEVGTTQDHLRATMAWLCAAQDATAEGGVAAFYDVRAGTWGPLYPETTGYIIPTFYNYAAYSGDETYRARAVRMADWLLTLQLENGAFPIGPLWPDWERKPIVFDTGQILHGLVRVFEETNSIPYLEAARRAGDWLLEIQDSDGCWRKFTSLNYVHTYNVRTAWALLRLYQVTQDDKYRSGGVHNLRWSLTQQSPDGWFQNAAFRPNEDPLTHTIVYTIEGILESGIVLSDQSLIEAARLAADALRTRQIQDGYLRARYGSEWQSQVSWSCLTGTAQMAMVWFTLYELTGNDEYIQAALIANRYLKQRQCRHSRLSGVTGGIAGSYPIYGDYEPYRHLNWAAKFFADSLLLEDRLYTSKR